MLMDAQFENFKFQLPELKHGYGKNVHILADPYLLLGLSTLCAPETKQPQLHYWIARLYRSLLQYAVCHSFEKSLLRRSTRMKAMHPEAELQCFVPDPRSSVVVVNLARAGTLPSFVCYDELNHFFEPDGLRQDHIIANREVDEHGHVKGTALHGSKIGGSIDGTYVLVPDPMGATGSTVVQSHQAYKKFGEAKKWIALHLIITPEYLRNVTQACPDVEIYAIRLDRGLSSAQTLRSQLGEKWSEERGLNEKDYIVPGAGGLGEILNNTLI